MAQYTMWIFLLLNSFLLMAVSQIQDDDWIDPTDMLNYDAASGKMKTTTVNYKEIDHKMPSPAADQMSCHTEKQECEKKKESLLQEVDYFQKKEKTRSHESSSIPVFKRYLNKILIETGKLGLPDETNDEVHYDAEIILTRQTLSDINKFLTGEEWKSGALDDSLTDILINFKHHDSEAWKWRFEDYFGIDPYSLFLILLCLLCLVSLVATELYTHISWFTQLKRLFVISFIISVGWNWMYLYKVEFAQRQAEVAKMEKFDSKCSEKMDWADSLTEWATRFWKIQNDPCEEYFKALIVSPALMVPPTKALALTFTHFVTEPLKHVGQGIGEFIKGLLKELPLIYHVPVLIVMAVTALSFCYGAGKTLVQVSNVRRLQGPEREPPQLDDARRRREPDDRRRIDYIENLEMDGGRGDADHFDRRYNHSYEHDDRAVEYSVRARHVNSRNVNKNPKILQAASNVTAENQAFERKNHNSKNHRTLSEPLRDEVHEGKALEEKSQPAAGEQNVPESEDTESVLQTSEDSVKGDSNCSSEDCSRNYKDSQITQKKKENNQHIQNEILGKITVETVTSAENVEHSSPN